MTSPFSRRLRLAASLFSTTWILTGGPACADASELRFDSSIPAESARRWETLAKKEWAGWEKRLGGTAGSVGSVERPSLRITLAEPSAMPRELGRVTAGVIELNRMLPREQADDVLRHELAHVFLASRCPQLARSAPLLSEAFALWATGDALRRSFGEQRFAMTSVARDWLVAKGPQARGHEAITQDALARVLSAPEKSAEWEGFFAVLLGSCGEESFASSRALVEFLDRVRGIAPEANEPVSSHLDFLLVDGLSDETLATEGHPLQRFPTGSILKPTLFAAVPGLLEPRLARDTPPWRCPGPPRTGETFSWERALVLSCNGFFLDFVPSSTDAFQDWEQALSRLGLSGIPTTMDGRIGLRSDFTISPVEAVRLYAWLSRQAPFVLDALVRTAIDGTLSQAPESAWFRERGIALKSGTVRDVRGVPLHAWLMAAGPRAGAGPPSFIAALHATGRSAPALMGELKRRLADAPLRVRAAEVQILGLVPPGSVGLSCEESAPLLVRDAQGAWSIEPNGLRRQGGLETGTAYACPAAGLVLTFPLRTGSMRRVYHGTLAISELPRTAPADTKSGARRPVSARARLGSRTILTTSERAYVESSVLSEFPSGEPELLVALASVVRADLAVARHPGRPACDTTHCHLFGQEQGVSASLRRRVRAAVARSETIRIGARSGEAAWLPFSLGGDAPWLERRTPGEIREALDLPNEPDRIVRGRDGTLAVEANGQHRFSCEDVRNQLRLPSCPDTITRAGSRFEFRGNGAGHGLGLDLVAANEAAARGTPAHDLLIRFYPDSSVESRTPERNQ